MRIIRYLLEHKVAVCIIAALLVVQAICDLSIPTYTADIVNVGIQQAGVEHASPEQIRPETLDEICMLASANDDQTIRDSYYLDSDGLYHIHAMSSSDRSKLDSDMEKPMALWLGASNQNVDLAQIYNQYAQGTISKEQIQQRISAQFDTLSEVDQSMISQQAVAAATMEMTENGYDIDQIRFAYLMRTGLIMMGFALVGAIVAVLVSYLASKTAAKVGHDLRDKLYRRVTEFSDAEVQKFSAASLITRGTNDVQQVQNVGVMLLRFVLYAPIMAVGGIVMMLHTDAQMGWVVALAIVAVVSVVAILFCVAVPKFRLMQKLIDKVNLVARELLTGLPVVRAFNRQDHEEKRFDAASTDLMRTQLFTNRVMTFMQPTMMLIMNGVSILIVWVGCGFVDAGSMQVGSVIASITYAMQIIMSFLIISMVSIMLPRANVAAKRINEVITTQPRITDPSTPLDAKLQKSAAAKIEFKDVTFEYPGSHEPVLSHISFCVEPGTTTAIVGATGSGKSTLLKLALRMHDVTCGHVLVDDIDVRDLSQHALRHALSYVPQKAFLFQGTIKDNVSYADRGMDEQRIETALSTAQATDFVSQMQDGIQAQVSQGGTNVSGGQRQRLSIARALAAPSRAILFDDSFSALDFSTDAALRQALAEHERGRTKVIVAQRISTVLSADQIVVVDEGKIVGCGTHADLMKTCRVYQEIAHSQLSDAELEGGDVA